MSLLFTPLGGLKLVNVVNENYQVPIATPVGFKTASLKTIAQHILAPVLPRITELETRNGVGGFTLALAGDVEGSVNFTGQPAITMQVTIPAGRVKAVAVEGLSAALTNLETRLETLEQNPYDVLHAARLTEVETQTAALDGRLDRVEADQTSLDTRLSSLESTTDSRLNAVESGQTTLDGRLDTVEGMQSSHGTRLTALESSQTATDGRLDVLEATDTSLTDRVTTLESGHVALDSRLDAVESEQTSFGMRLTAAENSNTSLDTRVDALETGQTSLDTRMDLVEAAIADLQQNGGGGTVELASWTVVTANTVMQAGGQYLADARNGALTLTVPSGLTAGQGFLIKALGNTVTIARGTNVFAMQGMGPTDDLGLAAGQKAAVVCIGNGELIVI